MFAFSESREQTSDKNPTWMTDDDQQQKVWNIINKM